MWYVLEDSVPANTTRANARETSIKVHRGILHSIFVTMPQGNAGTSNFQLRKGGYYILPRNEDKSMNGEHASTNFREWLFLPQEQNRLTLKTWNTSTKHPHLVRLVIGVLPKEVAEMPEMLIKDMRTFLRLFRRRT